MSDRDDEIRQDRLLDMMEKVAQRDRLHWDTNRGLIHERALAALAAADAVQPADDRRMVDLDEIAAYLRIRGHRELAEHIVQRWGREFGGSAPSEDWRCECGDLNRDHEAFCYRCGAGQ